MVAFLQASGDHYNITDVIDSFIRSDKIITFYTSSCFRRELCQSSHCILPTIHIHNSLSANVYKTLPKEVLIPHHSIILQNHPTTSFSLNVHKLVLWSVRIVCVNTGVLWRVWSHTTTFPTFMTRKGRYSLRISRVAMYVLLIN